MSGRRGHHKRKSVSPENTDGPPEKISRHGRGHSAGKTSRLSKSSIVTPGSMTSKDEVNYCSHCGDSVKDGEREENNRSGIFHKDCYRRKIPHCKDAVKAIKSVSVVSNVQFMALHAHYLYGKCNTDRKENERNEKKQQRKLKVKELTDYISALRNSNGGILLIQIVGIADGESYTGAFDEFADKKLYEMLEDGSLFDQAYKKKWLKNNGSLTEFSEFLALYVEKGKFLSTSDFNTKIALDFNLEVPLPSTMRRFVGKETSDDNAVSGMKPVQKRELSTIKESQLTTLQECRTIQLKSIVADRDEIPEGSINLGQKIWSGLRLKEYISAFTKNEEGGSYFLGIGEKEVHLKEGYITKRNIVQGFSYHHTVQLKKVLEELITKELYVLYFSEGQGTRALTDYIQIQIVQLTNNRNVMEVAVSPTPGIVFYDKNGPEAYRIKENRKIRIDVKEWFKAMKSN